MAPVSARYALRSTGRNVRRTALSVAGIAVGCALALLASSFNRGRERLYARAVVDNGVGHLRVVPAGWKVSRDDRLRLAAGPAAREVATGLPGVELAAARIRAPALLAMGTRVVAVEAVGVEAEAEARLDRTAGKLRAGRWLRPGERGAVVVGQAVLDRLKAEPGDELLATAVGKGGAIESAMLTVVGAVATGSEELDAAICRTGLAELEALTGRPGAGEVTVRLRDPARLAELRAALQARLPGDEVMTWEELTPDFRGHIEQDSAFGRLFAGIILLVVLLGVGSAQLAAVLERRREIAVLSALGMDTGRLARLLAGEALLVGLAGAALGLAVAVPVLARWATAGIDLRSLMGEGWSFQGVALEPVIYLDLGAWVVPYALAVSVGATLLASLWPAWLAARTDPAEALRSLP